MTPSSSLAGGIAVPLVYAYVDHLAKTAGARVLAIKGAVAIAHGYRDAGSFSSDADVIVEPARFGDFIALLEARGWKRRREARAPRYFGTHSASLYREDWPCDIDVHFRYPGFFADAGEAFDVMWARRVSISVAHRFISAVDPVVGGIVLAVHALRDPERSRSRSDLDSVARRFSESRSDSFDEELVLLAERLRARFVLVPLFERIGLDAGPSDLTESEMESWRFVVAGVGSTAFHWWVAFRRASFAQRLRLVPDLLAAVAVASLPRSRTAPDGSMAPPPWRRVRQLRREIREGRSHLER
ncbi:putative nucleotidyltransferase-like protein [Rathayibacter sp. PhB93]|uniref:nucleotidyltransferase family protein n=1 Tax=unclassified Rathayibacter TaxID=2609250 RepID=UPI000F46596A|nr:MULTISPECIES: nucleotidyltransferase family protein [unclassified Rathayibacter]ROQ06268.1 putative nucleotidyltransferase-like protein [Rathayibacter sp. PhB93]TDQ14025.1 putative nucleotidyltransferase-like protein [Rathayibacter sp. PhB1]